MLVNLKIYYGGDFQTVDGKLVYKSDRYRDVSDLDFDELSVPQLWSLIAELGYKNTSRIFLKELGSGDLQNSLRLILTDFGLFQMIGQVSDGDNSFVVKTLEKEHLCGTSIDNCLITESFLVKELRDRILEQPHIKQREIHAICAKRFQAKVSLSMCKRVRKKVLDQETKKYAADYSKLWDYATELKESNIGSTIVIDVDKETKPGKLLFKGFYVCFDAVKRGWKEGCRPIIGIDGCFLKGIHKGQLLCVVGRDSNNQMYPIAWGVVAYETKFTWGWFLRLLQSDLDLKDGSGFTITSDMQKGLVHAVNELLPEVEHRMCARHIYVAWQKKWKGLERKKQFWNCARSTFPQEFLDNLDKLETLGKGSTSDALTYPPKSWCRAFFSTICKCDAVENNMAETFNSWILDARCKPVIAMLEDIRCMVSNRIQVKRAFVGKWFGNLPPGVMEKLEENKDSSFNCTTKFIGDDEFEVMDRIDRHTVNLRVRTCSCRAWQLSGIPCCHSISAIDLTGKRYESYMDPIFTKEHYLKAYAYSFKAVRGPRLWPKTGKDPLEPPVIKAMPGRPKKCRRKAADEPKKQRNRMDSSTKQPHPRPQGREEDDMY